MSVNSSTTQMNGRTQIMPFGIVVACHAGDYCMAKATCASIRHFSGDLPICLVVDGDFSVRELVDAYGVLVLRTSELRDPEMRRLCCGNPRAKLAAMWEGPFERYIFLDADVVFWGDVVSAIGEWTSDFLVLGNPDLAPMPVNEIKAFYIEPSLLARFDSDFDTSKYPFFCSGAFGIRKNLFPFNDWMAVEKWRAEEPNLFSFTRDQGIFNYLVFKGAQQGRISVQFSDLQYMPAVRPMAEVTRLLGCDLHSVPRMVPTPMAVHFCERKPLLHVRKQGYIRPFTAFRLAHHANRSGWKAGRFLFAWSCILKEEAGAIWHRAKNKLRRHALEWRQQFWR